MNYKIGDIFKVTWSSCDFEYYILAMVDHNVYNCVYNFICITAGKYVGGRLTNTFTNLNEVENLLNEGCKVNDAEWVYLPEANVAIKEN